MKILNCMFGKQLGGLEQSFIDYNNALMMKGNDVLSIIHPKSQINPSQLSKFTLVSNMNSYDFIALYKLRKIVSAEKPDCIITHGKRATALMRKAAPNITIIAVSHKSSFDYLKAADGIIAITKTMKDEILKNTWAKNKVYYVPNMILIPEGIKFNEPQFRSPISIGVIGRFTPEKGHLSFIKALDILRNYGCKFKAVIAGDGPQRPKIEALITQLNLQDHVELKGWIEDKKQFYESVDVICVPSEIETFGLVILEAFLYSKPCIATRCSGPVEIGSNEKDILLYEINNHSQLADKIIKLINHSDLSKEMARLGFEKVQNYSDINISNMLQKTIEEICLKY